jgi:hypothetical protein
MATKKNGPSKATKKGGMSFALALTAGGSRTFAQSFLVQWTPSSTSAQLTVNITAGGDLLTSNTFTPGNATQQINGTDGTFSVEGTLIAVFNSTGTTGTLLGQGMIFTAPNGGKTTFSGVIGLW